MPEPSEPELPRVSGEPLSVVLVAYNVAGMLPGVVGEWVVHLESLKRPYEIIVVDDGSDDGTGGLARFLAGRQQHIVVLGHCEHRGLGAALRTALAAARHPLFFYTTCD